MDQSFHTLYQYFKSEMYKLIFIRTIITLYCPGEKALSYNLFILKLDIIHGAAMRLTTLLSTNDISTTVICNAVSNIVGRFLWKMVFLISKDLSN